MRDTQPAMSEENVEVVRRGFAAALREEWPAALETLAPDVEIHDFDIPDAGVIALFRIVARGGHSGMELERDDAIVYRLRGGRIVRLEYFNDRRRALAAAGLD